MDLFDWDDANIRHISQHGVSIEEAQEALLISPIDIDSYVVGHEARYENIGRTAQGRILKVISTERQARVRVVTAFDASAGDKRRYHESMVIL